MTGPSGANASWPELPYLAWKDTYAALHLWTQIVGKVRLALTPWLNHSWHVALYVTPRGLGTSSIPNGEQSFDMEFDFIDHLLAIRADSGERREVRLYPRSVASFYAELMGALAELGIEVQIDEMPNEIADAVRFSEDHAHASYDPNYAWRHWRVLLQADRVLKLFRTAFIGKASPVHFFWGSFDLAATRFSGRRAPLHPGGVPNLSDDVTCEAYSHEVSSAGFWPGNEMVPYPAFYAYAYPQPDGFAEAKIGPKQGFYHQELREFILPYDAVRSVADPDAALLEFLQSTYEAAADLGGWDRAALECGRGVPGRPRPI